MINTQCTCHYQNKNKYYISNKDLLEECDKEENVAVTVAATASV